MKELLKGFFYGLVGIVFYVLFQPPCHAPPLPTIIPVVLKTTKLCGEGARLHLCFGDRRKHGNHK
jgi:hypothetical protein